MKYLKTPLILALFITLFIACFPSDNSSKNLDEALFGTWVYYENDLSVSASWTFNDDGTCVQFLYNQNYDWLWEIEEGQLKLYVEFGIPAYKTYNIDDKYLYFYSDELGVWGLPFTKT